MKNPFSLLFVSMLLSISTFSQSDTFFSKTDFFLKKYVTNNKVDYVAIKANPHELDELVKIISNYDLSKDANSNKAFLINAYNLLVIKGITVQFPVSSPLAITGFFDKTIYTIANRKTTLNDIENKMLRAKYNDARLHFVLVCGANGCPPIVSEAYLPECLMLN